ncbi:hypothetical protein [Celerinatantimonas yamalensis]|uniref:Uncharacterized protein n=1 Tax=Celerinatantimonas yamalensis TaxID=559956 RepID=A0ABW9G7E3_9GAMM
MGIEFLSYQESDKNYIWDTYVKAMRPHIEKMWGWDAAWQEKNFEQSLVEYHTSILKIPSGRVGHLQVKYNPENIYNSIALDKDNVLDLHRGPQIDNCAMIGLFDAITFEV